MKTCQILVVAMLCTAGMASGADITLGDHWLIPNRPNQTIAVNVTGGNAVAGFNLLACIGDGLGASGEPVFQSVSYAGAIWGTPDRYAAMGTTPYSGAPMYLESSVALIDAGGGGDNTTVAANGKLLTLTLDTTGFSSGSYALKLTDIPVPGQPNGTSELVLAGGTVAATTTIANGTLNIARPGDANLDGRVDDNDLNILLSNWNSGTDWGQGNFKNATVTDDNDLNTLLSNWDGSGGAVPEPATLSILALAGLAAMRRRRR